MDIEPYSVLMVDRGSNLPTMHDGWRLSTILTPLLHLGLSSSLFLRHRIGQARVFAMHHPE